MPESEDLSVSTPSAEALGADYATWMNETKPEFLGRIHDFVAILNIEALRTLACQTTKSECTNIYHIWTGNVTLICLLCPQLFLISFNQADSMR